MIRPNVIDRLRRGRTSAPPDALQLSYTVVPLPGASMRVLEFAVACTALAAAILLGLAH